MKSLLQKRIFYSSISLAGYGYRIRIRNTGLSRCLQFKWEDLRERQLLEDENGGVGGALHLRLEHGTLPLRVLREQALQFEPAQVSESRKINMYT